MDHPSVTSTDVRRASSSVSTGRVIAVMTRLPDRILLVLLGIFIATYSMAAFDVYHPWTVGPLALVLVILLWRYVPTDIVPTRAHAWTAGVVIVLALIWTGVQLPFESEFLVANRDPGIYSNIAVSLATTGHSSIDVSQAVEFARGIRNATANLGSFVYESDNSVRLQGGDAVASLVGVGYWLHGLDGLTVANSVIGGISLISVYSFARRLLGPIWGTLPPIILGLSMPMVYFSRAPYTEVISLAIFLGALTWLWAAFTSAKRSDFVVAGIFAGATAMTRIDATLGLALLVAAFVLILLGVARPRGNFPLASSFIAWTIPMVVLTGLSVFDLLHNFNRYVHDLGSQSTSLWVLLVVVILSGFIVLWVRLRLARGEADASREGTLDAGPFRSLGRPLGDKGAARLGWALGVLVPVLFAFWALRPLFVHFHFGATPGVQAFVASLQRNAGLPEDGTMTYDEYSLYWFVWFFGAPFLIATAIGMGILAYRAVTRRRPGLLAFWVITMGVALLYENKISIAPDQMWAFRRVLPIVAPSFCVAAVWTVRWLWNHGHDKWRSWGRVAAAIGVALIVGGTALSWNPHLFRQTEYSNQANEVRALCGSLGNGANVVLVTPTADPYALTLATMCRADVVTLLTTTGSTPNTLAETQASLAALSARMGADTRVVSFSAEGVPWDAGLAPHYRESTIITTWERTLLRAPDKVDVTTRTAWLGELQPDGTVRGE